MKKTDILKSKIDVWLHTAADYLGGKMESVRVDRRKTLLVIIFAIALIFLIGQTVMAFMKLQNNI